MMEFFTAPEELIADLAASVERVMDMVAVGLLLSNASKIFKALSPPQNESLSLVQGMLQSV